MITKTKKFGLAAILASFVFAFVFGLALFSPKPAQAQLVTSNPDVMGWLTGQTVKDTQKSFLEKVKTEGLLMVASMLMNGLNYFLNKIAYDMAVYLAAGDFGQGPFASSENFGNYLAQTAGDALGEALYTLSEDLGLDLCNLPDLRLDLMLKLGFHFNYGPPTPRCTWQQLKSAYNVENIRSKYASQEGLASRLGMGVQVEDSDFGVWFSGKEKIDTYAAEQTTGAQLDREEGSGIFAASEIISHKQTIPATVMREEFNAQSASAQKEGRQATAMTGMASALEKGGTSLALNTVSTFVNTLLGTVLNNFITKGLLPGGKKVCNPGLSISGVGWDQCEDDDSAESMAASYYSSGSAGTSNRRAAQEMFSEYLKPKIQTMENYDISPNMAECSEDNLLPESCIVDQSFLQILQQANTGEPFTIKQAMERGLLHADWKLIPDEDAANNQKFDCSQSAYCHRNIRYLRLARVLPLGFEIAANISSKDNPPTLKEVVEGYYDPTSNYYRLVNPHWVIKLPKMRCKSYVYSAIVSNGARLQTCADIQHCVGFNKDGSCQAWGYCLREKPIWKFKADYCDSQYNTCRAFTGSDGDTVGYLTRTLDTENCNSENDGCSHYANTKHYFSATSTDWYLPRISTSSGSFFNTSISFNKKATLCGASNDGCSAYQVAAKPETVVYLKKAPDYLFCYDADSTLESNNYEQTFARLANGISWPQTVADLSLLRPADAEKCKEYAQVCLPEEENCNLYTSALTREIIPGKFQPAVISGGLVTWNDQCDAKCVGYAAYQEVPSNYSNGNPLAYIIPSSGNSCGSSDAGCSAFTNLSTDTGGLEQTEYFSYLRLCILPDANKQKNFYVYESSEKSGYQLKTYTFEKDNLGGPKQIYHDPEEMDLYTGDSGLCDEESYLAGTADPDCHQFNDDQGDSYYAMLSKTVIVSDTCTPYRLNSPELVTGFSPTDLRCPYDFEPTDTDNRAGDTVELKENSCYYMGFTGNTNGAGDARSCTKEADSCRGYKGNAGNNVRSLVSDNFENTIEDWAGDSITHIATSSESTQLGGHSLKVSATTNGIADSSAHRSFDSVQKGKSYFLTFWAKGNLPIDRITIRGGAGEQEFVNSISVSDVWRYYSYGPLEYNGESGDGVLSFYVGNGGGTEKSFFLDNVSLKEVTDYIYLVKNSLSVDPICDSNPADNLPGEALGCMAYTDPAKNTYNLTNFSYLCREDAVGCTALLDTGNTPNDPLARAYNVWVKGSSGSLASVSVEGTSYSCQVPVGKDGCYTNILDINSLGNLYALQGSEITLTNSTVIVPPDTPSSSPIYLVASKNVTCKAENMGCQVLGKGKYTPSGNTFSVATGEVTHYEVFEEVAVKNDPALYDTSLCKSEENGCKSWKSGDSVYYFKDPMQNGKMVCKYISPAASTFHMEAMTIVTPDFQVVSFPEMDINYSLGGWAWKDVGICSGAAKWCMNDSECGEGNTCLYKNKIPCSPGFFSVADGWGLWSYGNKDKYRGFVGECPVEQSGCTEFVDHSSSGDEKRCAMSGQKCESNSDCTEESTDDICVVNTSNAYYLIDNNNLSEQKSVCNGQVSQAEGCVLLDNTNQPTKMYDTEATYQASIDAKDALINPLSSGDSNDANTIIKVTHDRICGEWAYCDLKQEFEDEETGEATSRCYHLGVCEKAGAVDNIAGKVVKECAVTVLDWPTKDLVLTKWQYQNTQENWDSLNYSGYSTYNTYQVPDLSARKVSSTYRLVYVDSEFSFKGSGTPSSERCLNPTDPAYEDGQECSTEEYAECYNGECLVAYNNSGAEYSRSLQCRAYPEMTSPFPYHVLTDPSNDVLEFKDSFDGVNLCKTNNGNYTSLCETECGYRKIKTDGGEVFEPISRPMEGSYVCATGPQTGEFCSGPESTECGDGEICSKIKSFQILNGWMGYCLERDATYRINGTNTQNCMTWWPIESPPGVPNLWDTDPKAGYEIADGPQDRFMCIENEPIFNRDRSYASSEANGKVNLGGLLVGIDTAIHNSSQTCLNDYSVQTMPKNNSYKIINQSDLGMGDNSKFAFTNLPSNVAVSGCYTADNEGEYVWGMAAKYSAAMYCPINRDTLILDGDKGAGPSSWVGETMALCTSIQGTGTDGMRYDDEQERWECDGWNPWQDNYFTGGPYHWNNAKWAEGYGSKFFNRNEIERIDVFIDEMNSKVRSNGWVSFIRDAVNADEGDGDRSFVAEQSWVYPDGDSSIHTISLDDQGKYGWTAWQYYGGSGAAGWTISDGTNDKGRIISQGLDTDTYHFEDVESTAANTKNIGIRVVWDESNNLRGIWLNLEGTDGDADYIGDGDCEPGLDMGTAFIIHFTHGKCKKFAQISNSASSTGIDFKPYPNYLNNNEVSLYESDASRYPGKTTWDNELYYARRTDDLNGGKYGLAFSTEDGYVDIRNKTAAFINPFTYYKKIVHDREFFHTQSGDINANYEFTGYNAGVALVSADSRTAKSNNPDFYDYTFSDIPNSTPYGKMLTKMFARAGSFWELVYDGGYNNGYSSYYGSVDASKPRTSTGPVDQMNRFPPRVAAPSGDTWELDKISVNGQTEGNIYLYSGSQTHIKFYAWAHGNQMPIRQIVVDKGDAPDTRIDSGMVSSIGNRKPVCADKACGTTAELTQYPCSDSSDCDAGEVDLGTCSILTHEYQKFGNTDDTGCKAKPWDFVTDYNCPYGTMDIVDNGEQISGSNIDWNKIRTEFYNAPYVCLARPQIFVMDNWGWCASRDPDDGGCNYESNASVKGYGCYYEAGSTNYNQCFYNEKFEPWVLYDGYVVVVPLPGS